MAVFLGQKTAPTRDSIIQDLRARGVLNYVVPELSDVVAILEDKYHPIELPRLMKSKLEFIAENENFKQYHEQLTKLTFVKMLQQVERAYSTMKLANLAKLFPFVQPHVVEKWAIEVVSKPLAHLRFDHLNRRIVFGSNPIDSSDVRTQISIVAKSLESSLALINSGTKAQIESDKSDKLTNLAADLAQRNKELLERKTELERRKQRADLLEKRRIAEIELQAAQEALKLAKQRKLEVDNAPRKEGAFVAVPVSAISSIKSKKNVQENVKSLLEVVKAAEAKATPAPGKGGKKAKAEEKASPAAPTKKSNASVIAAAVSSVQSNDLGKTVEELKAEQEHEALIQLLTKQLNYTERAIREKELPMRQEKWQKSKVEEAKRFEEETKNTLIRHKEDWETRSQEKQRLARIFEGKDIFEKAINDRRKAIVDRLLDDREEKLGEFYAQRSKVALKEKQEKDAAAKIAEEKKIKEEQEAAALKRKQEQEREEQERAAAEKEANTPKKFVPSALRNAGAASATSATSAASEQTPKRSIASLDTRRTAPQAQPQAQGLAFPKDPRDTSSAPTERPPLKIAPRTVGANAPAPAAATTTTNSSVRQPIVVAKKTVQADTPVASTPAPAPTPAPATTTTSSVRQPLVVAKRTVPQADIPVADTPAPAPAPAPAATTTSDVRKPLSLLKRTAPTTPPATAPTTPAPVVTQAAAPKPVAPSTSVPGVRQPLVISKRTAPPTTPAPVATQTAAPKSATPSTSAPKNSAAPTAATTSAKQEGGFTTVKKKGK
eukprot:TRINITY_DN603_c0_g1_i1.p1 TRINITY_DN603_c0_g1~~TRINITY_DN603_c0_g1_i1.p1  ORF type:complete len:892 (-),score=469.83 TRINITY_DN603_c0_g1_i1:85-2418(-)